jgi:hypothetical protein
MLGAETNPFNEVALHTLQAFIAYAKPFLSGTDIIQLEAVIYNQSLGIKEKWVPLRKKFFERGVAQLDEMQQIINFITGENLQSRSHDLASFKSFMSELFSPKPSFSVRFGLIPRPAKSNALQQKLLPIIGALPDSNAAPGVAAPRARAVTFGTTQELADTKTQLAQAKAELGQREEENARLKAELDTLQKEKKTLQSANENLAKRLERREKEIAANMELLRKFNLDLTAIKASSMYLKTPVEHGYYLIGQRLAELVASGDRHVVEHFKQEIINTIYPSGGRHSSSDPGMAKLQLDRINKPHELADWFYNKINYELKPIHRSSAPAGLEAAFSLSEFSKDKVKGSGAAAPSPR